MKINSYDMAFRNHKYVFANILVAGREVEGMRRGGAKLSDDGAAP